MLGIDWPRANLFLTLSAYARTHQKRCITSMYPVGAFIFCGLVSMEGFNKEQQEGLITLQQSLFVW